MATDRKMEFCLLGPLVVRCGAAVVPVPPGLQRSLLAALLLNANRVVPYEELAEALWGSEPPASAQASLQNTAMRLRRALAGAGRERIVGQPGGYLIRLQPGELDADRFEVLLAAGQEALRAGSHADAAARLRAALELWRGQPLTGVTSELLALREVPRLAELRLQAQEARIDADLRLGRYAEVISELKQLAAANPLRERLHVLMMLALYGDGQQAAALAAYQAARRVLVDQLGVEPGQELRQLHQQILAAGTAADPACRADRLVRAATDRPGLAPDLPVPHQLPSAVRDFAGRDAELAALAGLLGHACESAGAVVISAISGTAGIGKTALAVHWAHQVADRFPDGQLYVNLRGFGPDGPPMKPQAAMRLLLDGLRVPAERIPAGLDAQAAAYRSLLAGKRMLVVLDNVSDPAQAEPLLPGSAGCLVLVTSRSQLAGLAASHGAHQLTLDVLSEAEAQEMLARRLGRERVEAEPAAVTELAALCARLPLALSIAAARAACRPGPSLTSLAAELRDAAGILDGLGTGDPATDVRSVFSWSYRQLSEPAARMFRMLGVHPGPDVTAPAAASLVGVSVAQARRTLAELIRGHLLTEPASGRYACHDLLRAYASELVRCQDGQAGGEAALRRVLDHYVHAAVTAALQLEPDRPRITLEPAQPLVQADELTDREQAVRWFRAEREVLLAATRKAAAAGYRGHAWRLPWALSTFLSWYGYWHELAATQEIALTALQGAGEPMIRVQALRLRALASIRLGACGEADATLREALDAARDLGDQVTLAQVNADLAVASTAVGAKAAALGHWEESLRLFRTAGNQGGVARALNNVGWFHTQNGSHARALELCGQALAIFRDLACVWGQAGTLDSLGYAHHHLGHHAEAIACYQQAIEIQGRADDPHILAELLIHLGDAHDAAGQPHAARQAWQDALRILDELHEPGASQVRSRLASHPSHV